MKYLRNLRYLIKHKWYVFLECLKYKLIWQGLIHDWSKFRFSEFIPYANHFYGGREKYHPGGYYKPFDTGDEAFDLAWLLHQHLNPHHWQYWILNEDEGNMKVMEMPLRYAKEMLCDWRGAGRAQGYGDNTKEWYIKHKDIMQLHSNTRKWIEDELKDYG